MTLATKIARAARVPKGPTEYEIHVAVVAELHRRKAPGVRWYHTPNEGRRSPKYAAGLRLMGVSSGVPDLTIVRARVVEGHKPCARCMGTGWGSGAGEYTFDKCRVCDHGSVEVAIPGANAALELKRKGAKPRPEQAEWLAHLAAAGWLTLSYRKVWVSERLSELAA